MQTLELFAGCGGLAKGLELAGFQHAGLLEINSQACASLRANFSPDLVHEIDIQRVDFKEFADVDIVSGGPPCQPFSLGGLAKAFLDKRDMFPQAIRAISEIRPKAFLFENVKGLLRAKFEPYFKYIINRLTFPDCTIRPDESWEEHARRLQKLENGEEYKGLRYSVQYKLLNAADYGVPQVRERVFIVGIREDIQDKWTWPERKCRSRKEYRTIQEALYGIPDPKDGSSSISDHVFIDGARTYPGHTGSDITKPAKTIKAGAHGVPGGENMIRFPDGTVRYMTVYEAKQIQTFPKDFRITGSWGEALRQIGNAVPVRLAESVGKHLYQFLENACGPEKATLPHEKSRGRTLRGEQMLLAIEPKPKKRWGARKSKKAKPS